MKRKCKKMKRGPSGLKRCASYGAATCRSRGKLAQFRRLGEEIVKLLPEYAGSTQISYARRPGIAAHQNSVDVLWNAWGKGSPTPTVTGHDAYLKIASERDGFEVIFQRYDGARSVFHVPFRADLSRLAREILDRAAYGAIIDRAAYGSRGLSGREPIYIGSWEEEGEAVPADVPEEIGQQRYALESDLADTLEPFGWPDKVNYKIDLWEREEYADRGDEGWIMPVFQIEVEVYAGDPGRILRALHAAGYGVVP